jgi:hypothetical protein
MEYQDPKCGFLQYRRNHETPLSVNPIKRETLTKEKEDALVIRRNLPQNTNELGKCMHP